MINLGEYLMRVRFAVFQQNENKNERIDVFYIMVEITCRSMDNFHWNDVHSLMLW